MHPAMQLAALGAVLVALGLAQPAHAVSITVSFTGGVSQVNTNAPQYYNVAVGEEVRGSFTYQYPQGGNVVDSMGTLFGSGTSRGASCSQPIGLIISNDSLGEDRYSVRCTGSVYPFGILSGAFVDDSYLFLELTDPTMQALQSNELPQEAPDLELFTDRSFLIHLQALDSGGFSAVANIYIRLDSMVIPEPSSGGLLLPAGAATVLLAVARRRGSLGYRARAPHAAPAAR